MNAMEVFAAGGRTKPLNVTQDTIDVLCKESKFWELAVPIALRYGYWKIVPRDERHETEICRQSAASAMQ
jgi:hypothetical protein